MEIYAENTGADPVWVDNLTVTITAGATAYTWYEAFQDSYNDYYPFGSLMPGRTHSSPSYRYGFNGFEKDDELKGSGNQYTTLERGYDPRLGRWISVDPSANMYPGWTPYKAFYDNPIYWVDPTGGNEDEWAVNVQTGEKTWMSDKGGSEVQIINYVDNEGHALGTTTVEGPQAYVGQTRNGWGASNVDLWSDIPGGYNSQSGYSYTMDELVFRHRVLHGDLQNHGWQVTINNWESSGQAQPLTGTEFYKKYGDGGNFYIWAQYLQMAFEVAPAAHMPQASAPKGMTLSARGLGPVPMKARAVLNTVKASGEAPEGYIGGRSFKNNEGLLPKADAGGNPIKYREWDVNPFQKGVNRGSERIVTGSDGRSYYTGDHYRSFHEIR